MSEPEPTGPLVFHCKRTLPLMECAACQQVASFVLWRGPVEDALPGDELPDLEPGSAVFLCDACRSEYGTALIMAGLPSSAEVAPS